jgi:hypothetical protein
MAFIFTDVFSIQNYENAFSKTPSQHTLDYLKFSELPSYIKLLVKYDISDFCSSDGLSIESHYREIKSLRGDLNGDGKIIFAVYEGGLHCSMLSTPIVVTFTKGKYGTYIKKEHQQAVLMYAPKALCGYKADANLEA